MSFSKRTVEYITKKNKFNQNFHAREALLFAKTNTSKYSWPFNRREVAMKIALFCSLSVFILSIVACGNADKETPPQDSDELLSDGDALPAPVCLTPGDGPYPLVFTDVTDEIGFSEEGLVVAGSTITTADINNDGWPDLYISKGGKTRENSELPTGLYRLLLNNKGTGFTEVTWTSGLFKTREGEEGRVSSFVIWGDVNNDGFVDAFNTAYLDSDTEDTGDRSSLFLGKGDGTFTIAPHHQFFAVYLDPLAGASFLDYDRDGKLDLFAGHHYGTYGYPENAEMDTLHRGGGNGKFTNVTKETGLATLKPTEETIKAGTNHKPTWGVTACDVDGDGWQDLMTTTYGRGFNMFWRNMGGTFEDLSLSSKFAEDENLDYADDQWFLCYCKSHTDAGDYCADAANPSITCTGLEDAWEPGYSDHPARLGGNSSGTVCADIDNDGDLDLLGVELAHWHIGQASDKTELLRNDGFPAKPFTRPGREATGILRTHISGWNEGDLGALAGDLDNDGRIDLYVLSSDYPGTYALLYQQQDDGTFKEVGKDTGTRVIRSHGATLIDYDRDGDYDLVVGSSLMRWSATDIPPAPTQPWVKVLRNDTGQNANRFLFSLEGSGKSDGANRMAIGARITIKAGGKTFVHEVQGGYGLFGFQNDPLVIIGAGDACIAEEIKVRWPNKTGNISIFKDVSANQVLKIHEENGVTTQTLEEFAAR